jgi:2,3-diaminopropionate biosynthesis protein SbnB
MRDGDLLILKGDEVSTLLAGQERALIDVVKRAYEAHARGDSSLPNSTFLRFPNDGKNRIIALPAYLGSEFKGAGIKWVSSFPGNVEMGLDRASAVVILNSPLTGRPRAILEGSVISAKRTAASAALAAQCLHHGLEVDSVGLLGCGLINFEIARFLLSVFPEIQRLYLYDINAERARQSKGKAENTFSRINVETVGDIETLFKTCPLVSIATTATEPHIFDRGSLAQGSTLLHISLRDLSPELILSCDNVVDDVAHVCHNQTSVHLAEQLVGNRDFIRCNLADIMTGAAVGRKDKNSIVVFSPFGLGVLDIAVSEFVYTLALEEGLGTAMTSFLPESWIQRS